MKATIVILSLLFTLGCSCEKHTGPVTVQGRWSRNTHHGEDDSAFIYQLLRPNHELFVMKMARTPEGMYVSEGDSFTDIVYYDKWNERAFVKGEGYKPAPAAPETMHGCWADSNGQYCK